MATGSRLGDYLRVRRERLRPEEVGLPPGGRRRVPGLRREEVALLAGISVEYYLRLEQGRDQHPSDQVLDAIAGAMRLDPDAETYLRDLARPARSARHRPARSERVSASVQTLIDNWTTTPAMVQSRYLTTLAANSLAVALSPYFAPGTNTLRAAFLEPEMREFYRDWGEMTAKAVAYLRSIIGGGLDDPGLVELVGELSLRSERFRTLWARQDVRQQTSGLTRLLHPQVGPLDLQYEKLALPGTHGQMLVTYHAERGTESHERLLLLAHLAEESRSGEGGTHRQVHRPRI
ncbi:helix-turn-helix domain-containing protein [Actinopolymorpha pittospori]|uniref:Transcriptional regulator with XRE-family HTH domain n=1 Tax=Actinopolymorpha pittospori TaxID=648752 RepID=A0A927N1Q0_9ACTN|nr:helix-turn-helix transcriptional regulator [Actinopolymorpha pittospori]MBE1611016.1 transcriptional regulator with XRE-family HTH domain [Actinopolymorpha pittospori]